MPDELVHSIFPGWAFAAADAAAAHGVHGALPAGDRRAIGGDRMLWGRALSGFTVELVRDGGVPVRGHARTVLGGPAEALRFLVREPARHPASAPLAANELVTAGTLTAAMPAVPGAAWPVRFDGIDLRGARLAFGSVETALRGGRPGRARAVSARVETAPGIPCEQLHAPG
jgi:2-oxo-3-hexenedioate decarboxylase